MLVENISPLYTRANVLLTLQLYNQACMPHNFRSVDSVYNVLSGHQVAQNLTGAMQNPTLTCLYKSNPTKKSSTSYYRFQQKNRM